MRTLAAIAALFLAALPAAARAGVEATVQHIDPMALRIIQCQIASPDKCITGVERRDTGAAVPLQLGTLAPLVPVQGLIQAAARQDAKAPRSRRASEQLKGLSRRGRGWR